MYVDRFFYCSGHTSILPDLGRSKASTILGSAVLASRLSFLQLLEKFAFTRSRNPLRSRYLACLAPEPLYKPLLYAPLSASTRAPTTGRKTSMPDPTTDQGYSRIIADAESSVALRKDNEYSHSELAAGLCALYARWRRGLHVVGWDRICPLLAGRQQAAPWGADAAPDDGADRRSTSVGRGTPGPALRPR